MPAPRKTRPSRAASRSPAARTPPGLASRRAAVRILRRIIAAGQMLDDAIASETAQLETLSPRDRALTEQIVRTALRHRGQIEAALSRFMRKKLPRRAGLIHALLLAAGAQLLFMRTPAHAVISTAVTIARQDRTGRHMAGMVNAVLRRLSEQGRELLPSLDPLQLNVPDWLRKNWIRAWGESTARAIASALLTEPALDITVRDPAQAAFWAERLDGELLPTGTIRVARATGPVTLLPGFAEGAWWAQDAAAALPARLAGNVAGRHVLDLCAAPGGKTAQLAAAGAHVTAVDISARRLTRLHENLKRLRLAENVTVVQDDILSWQPPAPADVVLLDAPCTATGTARRHPEVLWLKSPGQMQELIDLQRRMLERAASFVRPGGLLIYCVCAMQPEEGEAQIEHFLAGRSDFSRLPVQADEIGQQAEFLTPPGDVRTLPHMAVGESRGLDGFYIARLKRQA
jgi:16S rRNA (cytosine967-C5)-methyltransferase